MRAEIKQTAVMRINRDLLDAFDNAYSEDARLRSYALKLLGEVISVTPLPLPTPKRHFVYNWGVDLWEEYTAEQYYYYTKRRIERKRLQRSARK